MLALRNRHNVYEIPITCGIGREFYQNETPIKCRIFRSGNIYWKTQFTKEVLDDLLSIVPLKGNIAFSHL